MAICFLNFEIVNMLALYNALFLKRYLMYVFLIYLLRKNDKYLFKNACNNMYKAIFSIQLLKDR